MPLVTHVGGGTNARYSGLEISRAPAVRVGDVLAARGLVDDLRRRLRTPSRTEARDHRDARELVPADRDGARHAARVLRLEAGRTVEQGAARAGAAAAERVHGEQRVLRRELRIAATRSSRQCCTGSDHSCSGDPTIRTSREPSCSRDGATAPSVTRLALRNTFCDVSATETERMVGGNAIEVYNLDAAALRSSPGRSTRRRSTSSPRRSTRCPKRRERHCVPLGSRRLELK